MLLCKKQIGLKGQGEKVTQQRDKRVREPQSGQKQEGLWIYIYIYKGNTPLFHMNILVK